MPGWEGLIRISPATSWGTPGTFGVRGFFLNTDSTDLDRGAEVAERDQKLLGLRESLYDSVSVDRYNPRGGFTFQPRVDDLLMLLMAHFQHVEKSGTGTYTFYRKATSPDWTSGGSNPGTNVFSLNVDLYLGAFTSGTQANGIRFMNGIVDQLTFNLRYGEDLTVVPTFKFLTGSNWTYPTTFVSPSVYGSLSAYSRFVDYLGTVAFAGETFNIESWQGVFSNNTSDQSRLGQRGYVKFPFSGRWVADGQVEFEVARDIDIFAAGSIGSLTVDLFNGTANWIRIAQPTVIYRHAPINISAGNAPIMVTKPYRAYPASGTTGPSTIVTVYTGTTFATNLLGF